MNRQPAKKQASIHENPAREDALADIGELVGPVVHEINNFLNTVLLQIAVMAERSPECAADLKELRQQGHDTALLVKNLQHYLHQLPAAPQQTSDLNQLLRETLAELQRGPRSIQLALEATLPLVHAPRADLGRLCRFLLRNILFWRDAGSLGIRTSHAKGRIVLQLDVARTSLSPAVLQQFFEPQPLIEGCNSLELAACKRLTQRLQGSITVENRTEEGWAIVVELPAATTA